MVGVSDLYGTTPFLSTFRIANLCRKHVFASKSVSLDVGKLKEMDKVFTELCAALKLRGKEVQSMVKVRRVGWSSC